MGPPRARIEYDMLLFAKKKGINVPMPLGFITRSSGLFYRCWLVAAAVLNAITLVEISLARTGDAARLMGQVAIQVQKLILAGIFHRDLHPGNVIVDDLGRPYLIDFDKAYVTRMNSKMLAGIIGRRWKRAVLKHNLPTNIATCLED